MKENHINFVNITSVRKDEVHLEKMQYPLNDLSDVSLFGSYVFKKN